jgi:hypothetical protein
MFGLGLPILSRHRKKMLTTLLLPSRKQYDTCFIIPIQLTYAIV